jgi:hypothetical protein
MGNPERAQQAFALLWQAQALAEDVRRSVWDFAVEIDCLRASGLTNSDLRWLLGRGLVEHAHETTLVGEERRTFSPLGPMTLTAASCFILTSSGVALARDLVNGSFAAVIPLDLVSGEAIRRNGESEVPVWDPDRQELRFHGVLIKQFKLPAPNQEMVLAAFQEEDWPARIDDPLPGNPSVEPKRRLRETVTSLNRNQKEHLIQFMGDGSGQGVRWERVPVVQQAKATQ